MASACIACEPQTHFPVVAPLPPKRRERSDDRQCLCRSQATACRVEGDMSIIKALFSLYISQYTSQSQDEWLVLG